MRRLRESLAVHTPVHTLLTLNLALQQRSPISFSFSMELVNFKEHGSNYWSIPRQSTSQIARSGSYKEHAKPPVTSISQENNSTHVCISFNMAHKLELCVYLCGQVLRGALRLHTHVRLVSWLLRRYIIWCQDTRLPRATIMFFKRRAVGKHSLTNHTDMGTLTRCRYTCTLCLVVNVGREVYTLISWAGKRIAEVAATGTQPWIAGVQLGDCGRRKWTYPLCIVLARRCHGKVRWYGHFYSCCWQ